ncbi:hypothetical protein TWF281_010861 [Arthrobotrys megalospora]
MKSSGEGCKQMENSEEGTADKKVEEKKTDDSKGTGGHNSNEGIKNPQDTEAEIKSKGVDEKMEKDKGETNTEAKVTKDMKNKVNDISEGKKETTKREGIAGETKDTGVKKISHYDNNQEGGSKMTEKAIESGKTPKASKRRRTPEDETTVAEVQPVKKSKTAGRLTPPGPDAKPSRKRGRSDEGNQKGLAGMFGLCLPNKKTEIEDGPEGTAVKEAKEVEYEPKAATSTTAKKVENKPKASTAQSTPDDGKPKARKTKEIKKAKGVKKSKKVETEKFT